MKRSLSIRQAAEILAGLCYLSLYGAWFPVGSLATSYPLLPAMFWRFAAISAAGYILSGPMRRRLMDRGPSDRLRAAVAAGLLGAALSGLLFLWPQLSGRLLDPVWPAWLGVGILGWSRGLGLGSSPPDSTAMHRHLILGTASVTAAILISNSLGGWDLISRQALPFIGFWLVAVVAATALIRFSEMTEQHSKTPAARFWPPVLGFLALACLVLAVFFGLLAPVVLELLRIPASLLFYLVGAILTVVAYGLGFVAQFAIWLFRLILRPAGEIPPEAPAGGPWDDFDLGEATRPLAINPDILRWLAVMALLLAGIGVAAFLILKLRARDTQEDPGEERQSFASLDALSRWGRRRWGTLRNAVITGKDGLLSRVGRRPKTPVEFYHAVLALAGKRGFDRSPHVTPHRFQPEVRGCFSECEAESDLILHAFTMDFYGGQTPDPRSIPALDRAWMSLNEDAGRNGQE